jgi:hypothetical protein
MRPALAASLTVVLLSSLAAPANAYVRSRSRTKSGDVFDIIWRDPRVTLTVQTGGPEIVPADDFVAAATRAAATWSDPALDSSVFYTVVRSDEVPSDPAFDHQNTISFRTSSWDPPDYSSGELALTTVWVVGGEIVDTDTEINAKTMGRMWAVLPDDPTLAATSTAVDLQNAITHELGHVLGLDHPCYLQSPPDPPEETNTGDPVPSCSDPNLPASVRGATMFPSSNTGDIAERTLSPDEVLALHDLYPVGRAPVVETTPAPPGGCAVAGEGGGATPVAGALILGAGLLLAARRSARRVGHARRRAHVA